MSRVLTVKDSEVTEVVRLEEQVRGGAGAGRGA